MIPLLALPFLPHHAIRVRQRVNLVVDHKSPSFVEALLIIEPRLQTLDNNTGLDWTGLVHMLRVQKNDYYRYLKCFDNTTVNNAIIMLQGKLDQQVIKLLYMHNTRII